MEERHIVSTGCEGGVQQEISDDSNQCSPTRNVSPSYQRRNSRSPRSRSRSPRPSNRGHYQREFVEGGEGGSTPPLMDRHDEGMYSRALNSLKFLYLPSFQILHLTTGKENGRIRMTGMYSIEIKGIRAYDN